MNRVMAPLLIAVSVVSLVPSAVHAGTVDLRTFSPVDGQVSLAANLAQLAAMRGEARITGTVANVNSFDYRFQGSIPGINVNDGRAFFFLPAAEMIVDLASYTGGNFDTGLRTFVFNGPYSGAIEFVSSMPGTSAGQVLLSVSNLRMTDVVSAVPEPETGAMLLAGMGLMGAVVRRRAMRPAPAVVEQAA